MNVIVPVMPESNILPQPVAGERFDLSDPRFGRIACYRSAPAAPVSARPLLLVHSVNAAASAFEMKPLYERYALARRVYAFDLPGFGLSDRSDRKYTPRMMTDAVIAVANEMRSRHGSESIDIAGLSLSCEFVARAASEHPELFSSVALISPTGMDARSARNEASSGTRAMPWLHGVLTVPLWKRGLFQALTSRASIRFFLQKTWGSKNIDESLLEYDYLATRPQGAENVPFYFVSGYLFSKDAMKLYKSLTMTVWMSHGVRGDFVDFQRKTEVEALSNWRINVFETGAMPHFEQAAQFAAIYDAFLQTANLARA